MGDTKEQWKTIVSADDLDAHMLAIDQAQANAEILSDLLTKSSLTQGKVYVPGCGTGQLFELISESILKNYNFLFTDINESFLDKLTSRLQSKLQFRTKIDDIELTQVSESFDACIVVLLLEHINMDAALENMLKTKPKHLFVIIQAQAENTTLMVNTKRQLRPTIQKFAETAKPALVNLQQLDKALTEKGFVKINEKSREVPDNKIMVGLHYSA